MDKPDSAERADEREEGRLLFSLGSFTSETGCSDRRGMGEAREEDEGMMAVTGCGARKMRS